jgi:RNA recognition motif-containing protein
MMRGPSVVYVGNLPDGVKEAEIQDLFERVRER